MTKTSVIHTDSQGDAQWCRGGESTLVNSVKSYDFFFFLIYISKMKVSLSFQFKTESRLECESPCKFSLGYTFQIFPSILSSDCTDAPK